MISFKNQYIKITTHNIKIAGVKRTFYGDDKSVVINDDSRIEVFCIWLLMVIIDIGYAFVLQTSVTQNRYIKLIDFLFVCLYVEETFNLIYRCLIFKTLND